jgi:hypothetical protein
MNNISKISVFRNYTSTNPVLDIPLYDFCVNVIQGDYKTEIETLRTVEDKKHRDKIKATLPAVTISGTFAAPRTKETLTRHSGFVSMDFDSHHNPEVNNWPALRDSLSSLPEVYFSALSASGKGVFCIVPILYPAKHEGHYLALINDFKAIGLNADPVCKDISRLRGISYDPEAAINREAKVYTRIFETERKQSRTPVSIPGTTEDTLRIIERKMQKDGIFYSDGNKHKYLVSLFTRALHFNLPQAEVFGHCLNKYCHFPGCEAVDGRDIERISDSVYRLYSHESGSALKIM